MIKRTKATFKIFFTTLNIFLVLFLASNCLAQNITTSPYSRFGIGDLQSTGFAETDAMGSASIAVHEPFNINFSNPASYSSLKLTTFEFGAISNFTEYSQTGYSSNITNASNISYVALAFPVITNWWGASFGLIPYSNVGYNISAVGLTTNGDVANYLYTGSGGINQFYLGNAFNICKSVALGVNISDLFGSIQRQNTLEFPDLSTTYDTRTTNTIQINDFSYRLGLLFTIDSIKVDSAKYYGLKHKLKIMSNTAESLVVTNSKDTLSINNQVGNTQKLFVISNTYEGISFSNSKDTLFIFNTLGKMKVDTLKQLPKRVKIKSDHSFSIGITSSLNTNVKATSDSLVERYNYSGGTLLVHDTVNYSNGSKGVITLPLSIGFGISYKQGMRLLLSAEASMENWSKYSAFGQNDQLSNTLKMAAGAQIAPDLLKAKTFFGSITYRFGAYYNKTYLNLNSTQLNDIGFTFGLGLPVYRSLSKINLTFQFGQLGTLSNNLIKEDYARISIGFALADKWFNKHKYE
jgi:hypothetical protein